MLFWDSGKAPTEVADYDVDWSARLGNDTIVSSTWAITVGDSPASGTLTINSDSFSSTLTKVVLSAGTLGVLYTLMNTVVTEAGDTLIELIQLPVRNIAASSRLTTMANALQWVGTDADDDGYIDRLVAAVSTQIQVWLGYNVLQTNYSRIFDGQGTAKFFVPDIPLVSVQSLMIDGRAIPAGTPGTYSPGYYNNSQSINLIGYRFSRGFQNIAVNYTAGYATVPLDIEQACLDWVKNTYISGKQIIPSNVVKVSAGDTSFDYGGDGSSTDSRLIPMPSNTYAVLVNYRRVAQVSGW